ncbi:MAG: cyclic pyranopterin monophosphate synthase MoaC [Saprospiraceae bacterium]
MAKFSHIDAEGRPTMVNVQEKTASLRVASAQSIVELPDEVINGLADLNKPETKKGDLFQTAVLAGIMAAKKTGDLIPLCHPIGLDHCDIQLEFRDDKQLVITCTASVFAKTGVEMEAMVGASIAALTVYDMCKALSHDIVIRETRLMSKTGGKRDFKRTS